MNALKYEKISEIFVRNYMRLLNMPIRTTYYTLLGKALVFLGDTFCKFSLDLETNEWMKCSLLLWSVGVWFYEASNRYAWVHIIDKNRPTGKYNG
jgi:hypothetical protein